MVEMKNWKLHVKKRAQLTWPWFSKIKRERERVYQYMDERSLGAGYASVAQEEEEEEEA